MIPFRCGLSFALLACFVGCSDDPGTQTSSGPGQPGDAGADAMVDARGDGAVDPLPTCGNESVNSGEVCDDGNGQAGDGCDASCQPEAGWRCPPNGGACRAAACGDGIVAGDEECEDENETASDGCFECRAENGWVCDATSVPSPCRRTVCNDGVREGSEPCDDGNSVIGDGCSPLCEVEPSCESGTCSSACGDGLKLAADVDEACDDGNTKDGDGCSSTCQVEKAYACKDVQSELPDSFALPVVFRDFIRSAENGSSRHPDFEAFGGNDASEGMVAASLGADGKPVYTGICERDNQIGPCPHGDQTTSAANFAQWYSDATTTFTLAGIPGDVEGIAGAMIKYVDTLQMNRVMGTNAYQNATFGAQLFPLDGRGWVQADLENDSGGHNFGFTSEIRTWFEFEGGETLTFSGDDDVWVFIGGKLALDLGGLHPRRQRIIVLDAATGDAQCFLTVDGNGTPTNPCSTPTRQLDLVPNQVYEMALFHAERHTPESNFDLTLAGFVSTRSECVSTCGDGVVQEDQGEQCDDGNRDDYDDCDRNCQSFVIK